MAQADPGGEAHGRRIDRSIGRPEVGNVHAERAPGALTHSWTPRTDQWGTLDAHVVAAKGARGARVGGKSSAGPLPVVSKVLDPPPWF